jgi:hypothetical protein
MTDLNDRRLAAELERLRTTVRRLSLATAVALCASTGLAAYVAWQHATPPTRIELREGSRTAVLTPESLRIEVDGEQRVLLDMHSGLVLHDRTGGRVSVDPTARIDLYRQGELVLWANADDGWAAPH